MATKTMELRYPTQQNVTAKTTVEEAVTVHRDAENTLYFRNAANRNHATNLAKAQMELRNNPGAELATNEQVLKRGSGSGSVVVYGSDPIDPTAPPHGVESLAAAEKLISAAKGSLTKARTAYSKVKDETFDVYEACASADTRYYWRPWHATGVTWQGKPVAPAEILKLGNTKFRGLLGVGVIIEVPGL